MTSSVHYEVLFQRHPQNPILTAANWEYPAHTVFNEGATRLPDGTTLLLCRVEESARTVASRVALALASDFRTFERYGLVMQPDDKDRALLPRRVNGRFALLHRPWTDPHADIWMSFSPDLRNWGGHKLVLPARRSAWWDANRIGLSPPLIETSRGWLMLYHGVRRTAAGCLYRLG